MKNSLDDLNNHLFVALERLNDENLSADELASEIARAGALDRIAGRVLEVGELALDATRLQAQIAPERSARMPALLSLDGAGRKVALPGARRGADADRPA